MSSSALDTPMMRQYLAIKTRHPDEVVFYRMGDFYEMFLDDAELAAPLLDLTLTTRDKAKADAVPMCGVPVHSADGYVKRLAELGHRVAICEQVEDPRRVGGRRLVRRDVVEVITPGLVGDPVGIEGRAEVSVAALLPAKGNEGCGLAVLDASTGDFRATEAPTGRDSEVSEPWLAEIERLAPREVLLPDEGADALATALEARLPDAALTRVPRASFDPGAAPAAQGLDSAAKDPASRSAAALLAYLGANQPFALHFAPRLRRYALTDHVVLDAATRANLELFENSEDRTRRATLIERLDRARTPLGARRLARWLAYPLVDPAAIAARQDAVQWLADRDRRRSRLREALAPVRDLERILSKALRPGSTPRDLGALRSSLQALPGVVAALAAGGDEGGLLPEAEAAPPELRSPEPVADLTRLLEEGLVDEPPVVAKGSRGANETGYIRPGFRPELDALRESASKGREWIAGLETRERERTGITNLKVRFHPVHGYSLEVTKTNLARVPGEYQRKQTLANVERFTTDELSEVESQVMGEGERAAALEREILDTLRDTAVRAADRVRVAAEEVARVDAAAALAECARALGWVRPGVDASVRTEIRGGRHPVVESVLRRAGGDAFVPNDTDLDPEERQILLLTGPNMSGKSTYLRQVALITLLAQMGSFVPADAARIGAVDRVFTRVGASDRLARGESTFMVEMRETADILAQASRRSLVILDEIGRGTSTYDGLAIAWAVAEHLHDAAGLGCRTLFATHYHELTDLSATKARVHNGHFEAREWKEEVVFLRRLVPGGANRSYGIQVGRLAGLPESVVKRAKRILENLEQGELDPEGQPRLARSGGVPAEEPQLPLFSRGPDGDGGAGVFGGGGGVGAAVLEELRGVEPERTTPLEALALLQEWRERLEKEA